MDWKEGRREGGRGREKIRCLKKWEATKDEKPHLDEVENNDRTSIFLEKVIEVLGSG